MPNKSTPIGDPIELSTGSNSVVAVGRCKDFAGNSFLARCVQAGNDAYVRLEMTTPTGNTTYVGDFEMQDDVWMREGQPNSTHARKMVDLSLMLDGDSVVATVTGYALTTPTRNHWPEEYVWEHVAVPYPLGVQPDSGAGALMFRAENNPAPEPGGEPVDYDEIERRVKFVVETETASQVAAALEDAGVITLGNIHDSAGLYDRFRETTYEQVDKVMELRGVGHPIPRQEPDEPTATESPRP